ncbi:MAG: flavodoxin [Ruminococcus sp.]|nr:flavodoxin [Ruminococcus sp.]
MTKRILALFITIALVIALVACSAKQESNGKKQSVVPAAGEKALVAYFSRTGEQDKVGVIEKGNTKIVAEIIADETGADIFEIVPKTDNYPMTFDELCDVAKEEQNNNARPEIATSVEDFDDYSIIYLGYPIWWADLPMICYTFLESYDFSGKTIVPFCTHEGSADADTQSKIQSAVPSATVTEVLAIRGQDAQNDLDGVKSTISEWLN